MVAAFAGSSSSHSGPGTSQSGAAAEGSYRTEPRSTGPISAGELASPNRISRGFPGGELVDAARHGSGRGRRQRTEPFDRRREIIGEEFSPDQYLVLGGLLKQLVLADALSLRDLSNERANASVAEPQWERRAGHVGVKCAAPA